MFFYIMDQIGFLISTMYSVYKCMNKVSVFLRSGGSMVTYGGMAKQPVTVPVVSLTEPEP